MLIIAPINIDPVALIKLLGKQQADLIVFNEVPVLLISTRANTTERRNCSKKLSLAVESFSVAT